MIRSQAEIVDPSAYPTVPSQTGYSTMQRRDGYYQPGGSGTLGRQSTGVKHFFSSIPKVQCR